MPPPSDISQLPKPVVEQIDSWLLDNGFSQYQKLSDFLATLGCQISPSQISRHARPMKRSIVEARQKALEMAHLSALMGADERGKLIELAADIGISRSIEALAELDPIEQSKQFAEISRSVSSLGKLSLEQKKWDLISASELEQKLKQIETDESARERPSSPQEVIAQIRQTIFGFSALPDPHQIIDISSDSIPADISHGADSV
jgi:Protein of unknown function (DUF3486)